MTGWRGTVCSSDESHELCSLRAHPILWKFAIVYYMYISAMLFVIWKGALYDWLDRHCMLIR
jgi:hypothetical protein